MRRNSASLAPRSSFAQLWKIEGITERLVSNLTKKDLLSCRFLCRDLAVKLAPIVFVSTTVIFRRRALTQPSRVAALERIGTYMETVTFKIPHNADTFLPPVIDAVTGTEQTFLYMPQGPRVFSTRGKYGSRKIADLLIQQYPPSFHAATDVRSFQHVLSLMKKIRHLKISCEGQPPSHRYRRSVVDYALISLRIAVERTSLPLLESLSLVPVHPAAVLYLRPDLGFGTSPAARKRWLQIRCLTIHMDSFQHDPGLPTDHLKLLHAYLQSFPKLRKLVFRWVGEKNVLPLSLPTELCLQKSTNDTRSVPSYLNRGMLSLRPLQFHSLEHIDLFNVVTDAIQVASFLISHRHTLQKFNIEETTLRSGTWDEALAPLTQDRDPTSCKKPPCQKSPVDVPLIFSQQPLQRIIFAAQRQRGGLYSLAKAQARERLWGKPDHMKRLLPSSRFSWR
ncbi:hypothetical protein N7493_002372 [Penicillium malachiteum]|uniref:Uncharacterized protein n=1 Tax=Penicillium malachiteum TaxID=1324776 RepID=A0AAD6MYN1_9EURO|nr:hypothetical protein N7493_002372 [Penicillium malachiteum]